MLSHPRHKCETHVSPCGLRSPRLPRASCPAPLHPPPPLSPRCLCKRGRMFPLSGAGANTGLCLPRQRARGDACRPFMTGVRGVPGPPGSLGWSRWPRSRGPGIRPRKPGSPHWPSEGGGVEMSQWFPGLEGPHAGSGWRSWDVAETPGGGHPGGRGRGQPRETSVQQPARALTHPP